MIESPEIIQTAPRLAAIIHLIIPRNKIQTEMGPAIAEIMAAVKAQGFAPTGPWFTHHLKMDPATFDAQVCVPIPAPLIEVGRVASGEIAAVKLARTIHEGPYDGPDGLASAWKKLDEWIVAGGYNSGPDLYECYLTGPESNADPALWRTELSRPLID